MLRPYKIKMNRLKYRSLIKKSKIWVVKIGSSILTQSKGAPDPKVFARLAKEVAQLRKSGKKVILVSSGAIACGMHKMSLKKKPTHIAQKQAIAAAGQIKLMDLYADVFAKHRLGIAQILLTKEDIVNRGRSLNARHAIHELLRYGFIPIINENDTVAVDEIKVGDNDNLSAYVAHLAEANLLVILTDQEGVYTGDPRVNKKAQKISLIENINKKIRNHAFDTKGKSTTGGMITKIQAAEKAARFGVVTVIASGKKAGTLTAIAGGKEEGTLILPRKR